MPHLISVPRRRQRIGCRKFQLPGGNRSAILVWDSNGWDDGLHANGEPALNLAFRHQHTIAEPIAIEGFGYWSGQDVRVEFRPADVDTGIVFIRSDLDRPSVIPAALENRVEVPRRTNLNFDGATVEMVEHIMAALGGLCIDNCEVWVNRAEMPGCDGSSLPFADVLARVGRVRQPALRPVIQVCETIGIGDADCWVEVRPTGQAGLSIQYTLDYGPGPIGRQTYSLTVTPRAFHEQLAAARTFLLQEEAEWLQNQGLGRRVTCHDLLVFGPDGPIDNTLRFPDECVRHKTLDLIGDLALARCDIWGQIVAYRSGHRLNSQLVRRILAECGVLRESVRRAA